MFVYYIQIYIPFLTQHPNAVHKKCTESCLLLNQASGSIFSALAGNGAPGF